MAHLQLLLWMIFRRVFPAFSHPAGEPSTARLLRGCLETNANREAPNKFLQAVVVLTKAL